MFQAMLTGRETGDEEANDEHAVILDHAGDTYWRLGWKDRAVEFWKKAVELATKAKHPGREERALLLGVPAKIDAVAKGREPKVAPLGEPAPKEAQAPAKEATNVE